MTDYERRKRESHAVIGHCAYTDCTIEHGVLRASIDILRAWGPGFGHDDMRLVHAECFARAIADRYPSGGTARG